MWEIICNRSVLFGKDKVLETASILKHRQLKKVFLITYDKKAEATGRITDLLAQQKIGFCVYDEVRGEPDLNVINHGVQVVLQEKCDAVLALGGGSVMDAGKAIAMLATNGGLAEDYQVGQKAITKPALFTLLIPTTAGTGSEATKVSVIYNNKTGAKKSIYSTYMIADSVILDPMLTVKLPKKITASTGMDALSHAIESYLSLNANPMTEMYGLKAIQLINRSLCKAVQDGDDVEARSNMLLASYLGGCSLHAGSGAAHIIGQPLGGQYKIPHGDACSIFLPIAMEENLDYCLPKYREIAKALDVECEDQDDRTAALKAIERVREIQVQAGAARKLSEFIYFSSLDMVYVYLTVSISTGHLKNNPRPVDEVFITQMIQKAF